MDHHIAEQPAGAAHIFDRRRSRIAARDRQQFEAADAAVADLALEQREIRVEAAIETDHQRHAAFLSDGNARLGPAAVEVVRLFAEHRLAGARSRFDQVGVRVGRAGDDDRVDRGVGQRRGPIADGGAIAAGQIFCRRAVDVDDGAQPRRGMAADVPGVNGANPPGAELADIDHPAIPRLDLKINALSLRSPRMCASASSAYPRRPQR